MRIAIFGSSVDPLSRHTLERLRARGLDGEFIPLELLGAGAKIAFDGESWFFNGLDVLAFDGYVLRRMPSPHRVPPVPVDELLKLQQWWQSSLLQQENASAARSLLATVEDSGKPIVNPWASCQLFDYKAIQLDAFRRAGIPVPAMCITNATSVARVLAKHAGALIMKPLEGGAETRIVSDEFLAEDQVLGSPTIFQARVQGADVRATVVADRVVSCVEIPTDEVDYRLDAAYRQGRAQYVRHSLSPEVESLCVLAAKVSGHRLSGVDLKRTPRGDYVFLEANSAPMYLDIELKTGDRITDAVIDLLVSSRVVSSSSSGG